MSFCCVSCVSDSRADLSLRGVLGVCDLETSNPGGSLAVGPAE